LTDKGRMENVKGEMERQTEEEQRSTGEQQKEGERQMEEEQRSTEEQKEGERQTEEEQRSTGEQQKEGERQTEEKQRSTGEQQKEEKEGEVEFESADTRDENAREETSGDSGIPELDPAMFAPPSDVPSLAKIFISMLAESAWLNLGLMARPGTTEVSVDLKQVKLAIDSISALFTTLKGQLEDSGKREIEGLLTNLRLNFVEKSNAEEISKTA